MWGAGAMSGIAAHWSAKGAIVVGAAWTWELPECHESCDAGPPRFGLLALAVLAAHLLLLRGIGEARTPPSRPSRVALPRG